MKNLLQDSGLPSDAIAAIQYLVAGAGYDMDDPSDLNLGMIASMATLRVCDTVRTRRAPRENRVGRNDPCPCGSGKKHKKCCLKTGGADLSPQPYDPGDPLERVDLVPQIFDSETLSRDLNGLAKLFAADAGLRQVRFSPDKLLHFVMAEPLEEEPPPGDDPEQEGIDRAARVARYLREVEGIEVLGNLDRVLLRAARDSVSSDQDLRSVAAGVALWEMEALPGEDDDDSPNPLLIMLFWLTLQEALAAIQALDAASRARFAEELSSQPSAAGHLQALELPPLPLLPEATDSPALRDASARIRNGRFPVGMPLVSTLPAWVRVSLLDPIRSQLDEVSAAVKAGADALGPEDVELMGQALELWGEDEGAAASPEDQAVVGDVRTFLLEEGQFGVLGPYFILDAVSRRRCFSLYGEPELPERPVTRAAEVFTPEYLEACGDFLRQTDLPEMALRTWQLCALVGPVPPEVAHKVAALQQELAAAELP